MIKKTVQEMNQFVGHLENLFEESPETLVVRNAVFIATVVKQGEIVSFLLPHLLHDREVVPSRSESFDANAEKQHHLFKNTRVRTSAGLEVHAKITTRAVEWGLPPNSTCQTLQVSTSCRLG